MTGFGDRIARRDDGSRLIRRGNVGGCMVAGCGGRLSCRDDGGRLARRGSIDGCLVPDPAMHADNMRWFEFVDVYDKTFCPLVSLNFRVYLSNFPDEEKRTYVERLPFVAEARWSSRNKIPDPESDRETVRASV